MFQKQRPNFGLHFKTFIVMATICPLGRPIGWKNTQKKYFEIFWGEPHEENQNKHGKTTTKKKKKKKTIFGDSLGRALSRRTKNGRTEKILQKKNRGWSGSARSPKKTFENQKKIGGSLGRAPWRKQKKLEKPKNVGKIYSETIGLPSPRLLFFFALVFVFSGFVCFVSMGPSPKSLKIFAVFPMFFRFSPEENAPNHFNREDRSRSPLLGTPMSALPPGPRTPPGAPPLTPDSMNMVPVTPPELLGSPPRTPESQ